MLDALVTQRILTADQAQNILTREQAARARVLKNQGIVGKDAARYDVSPVEIVAAFQVPLADGRGSLDEDRVTEIAARAAGIADAEPAAGVEEALADIMTRAAGPTRVMICGSLYLAGAVLARHG